MEDLAVFCGVQDNPRHILLFELGLGMITTLGLPQLGCGADRYVRHSSLLAD